MRALSLLFALSFACSTGLQPASQEVDADTDADTDSDTDASGISFQTAPGTDADANDLGAAWCEASTPYGAGDLGTPGAPSDCP